MYSAILVLLAHLDDVTERWDDVDVDTSEIGTGLPVGTVRVLE